ncbi:hypothetical protein BDW42DRAFT_174070, partial [Aspergillus taichungensis]
MRFPQILQIETVESENHRQESSSSTASLTLPAVPPSCLFPPWFPVGSATNPVSSLLFLLFFSSLIHLPDLVCPI